MPIDTATLPLETAGLNETDTAPIRGRPVLEDPEEAHMAMDLILKNARVADAGDARVDIGISDGRIAAIEPGLAAEGETIDAKGGLVSPGLVETHIHLDKSRILDRCSRRRTAASTTCSGLPR